MLSPSPLMSGVGFVFRAHVTQDTSYSPIFTLAHSLILIFLSIFSVVEWLAHAWTEHCGCIRFSRHSQCGKWICRLPFLHLTYVWMRACVRVGACARACVRVSACVRAHVRVRACEYARGRWRAHALACERACACVYECLLTPWKPWTGLFDAVLTCFVCLLIVLSVCLLFCFL